MRKKQKQTIINHNSIPQSVEMFGRTVKTFDDTTTLGISRNYGEARYGLNHIALNTKLNSGHTISQEELKLTYLHELMHFILIFTGYDQILRTKADVEIEQFIELMASAIYQYEKTAEY